MAIGDLRAGAAAEHSPSILWKAFDVLGTFSQSRRVLTLSQVAHRSGLAKSTTHRVLTMLLELGAVDRTDDGYRMGSRMFAMGSCSTEVALRDTALPHLERLHRLTRQTVHLAVLEDTDVMYLEKLRSPASAVSPAQVGARLPAHATAVGKAMLAFTATAVPIEALRGRTTSTITRLADLHLALAEVRRRGVAEDRDEAVAGLSCIAAPVLVGDHPVAAISVAFASGPATVTNSLTASLRETAAGVSRELARSTAAAW